MRSLFVLLTLSVSLLALGACAAPSDDLGVGEEGLLDCSTVRCALPLCGPNQRLIQPANSCCPRCVGQPQRLTRCATILCAQVRCAEGEIAVTRPGQCCPQCQPAPPVAECQTDFDCPVYACFQCPCPETECRGNQCITETPDESTCYP